MYIGTGQHRSGNIYVSISSAIHYNLIDSYFLRHANRFLNFPRTTISVEPKNLGDEYVLEYSGEINIPIVSSEIVNQYWNVIAPRLDKYSDVIELDRYANTPFDKFHQNPPLFTTNGHWYRKMILAKLAGNSEYEKIEELVLSLYRKEVQDYPERKNYADALWIAEEICKELAYQGPILNTRLLKIIEN